MITLSLVPAILMGDKDGGWNTSRKMIASIWCLAIDSIYIIPSII